LERIRQAPFVTLEPTKDIPVGPVYVDAGGSVWAAPLDRGLMYIKGLGSKRVVVAGLDKGVVHSIAGFDNELWIGRQNGELTHLWFYGGAIRRATTYGRRDGLPGNTVSSVHRSANGTVWAGTIGGGVVKFGSKGFVTYNAAGGLASNVITSIADTPDGWTWFGTPRGLSGFSQERWHTFISTDELPSRNISSLFTDSTGVLWVGTVAGLAVRRAVRMQSLAGLVGDTILGIAEDRVGWLWISTTTRVLRVDRKRLSTGAASAEDFWSYGRSDGLIGAEGIRRQRSLLADAHGRIWLASRHGLSVFDPRRARENGAPAVVDIHRVYADGEALELGSTIRVPPLHRRLRIGYAGLNLSSPGRVRFRYRMDPFDREWSESAVAREAVYTNLGPGEYRFRVIASNADGEWNGEEAAIRIAVQPALWQTLWFRTSVACICAAAILFVYRRRLQHLKRQLNIRFEERLAERTRIAQELHDTLLQGFLSASMQLHVIADRMATHSEVKPQLHAVLNLMRHVIDEGRNAVRGLRSSRSESLDLEEAFSTLQGELGNEAVDLRVVALGTRRPLHPILRDEVYRIGREAIINALRHSGATRIDATIEYTARRFLVSVRDNGCGIDSAILQQGRDGHWGLPGMRERAERIGAKLRVWSSTSTGTEVELYVPGHVAFRGTGTAGFLKRLGWLYPFRMFHNGRER
ncbi:MAG TPA: two-component regulator propeller domain-containing protein, partial [Bryobacteraceae bacterium]|nr:two-component regulator propeller domain-containing protein [Bryobacteraceae bacterium]